MAQTLAGSLALVTCKEPLKNNLTTHIRQHLLEHGFNEVGFYQILSLYGKIDTATQQMIPEPAIALIVQDNLDTACSAIEKAAMERAVTHVDDGFAQAYDLRRRHHEVSGSFIFKNYLDIMCSFATCRAFGIQLSRPQIFLLPYPTLSESSRREFRLTR